MKRLISLVAVLACMAVGYAQDFEVDGIYYEITSDSTVSVGSFNIYSGSVSIPDLVKNEGISYSALQASLSQIL